MCLRVASSRSIGNATLSRPPVRRGRRRLLNTSRSVLPRPTPCIRVVLSSAVSLRASAIRRSSADAVSYRNNSAREGGPSRSLRLAYSTISRSQTPRCLSYLSPGPRLLQTRLPELHLPHRRIRRRLRRRRKGVNEVWGMGSS